MLTPEELYNNTSMIVGYYLQEGAVKQFIKYMIVREIEECFRTPQSIFKRNSTYTRVLKIILENELKDFFEKVMEIVTEIIEENKTKLVVCMQLHGGWLTSRLGTQVTQELRSHLIR